ncbi:hypothetical protein CNY89_15830 [Amaricoccus sp. HAR-UPW-R2A-40]|nr:hypothetical protein CNY89_15830 [Amaricoccus sp. HAR-UPW-R2A-40]
MTFARCASFAVLTAAFAASAVQTQAAAERIASHNDWTVFVAGEPKECYIVSQPTSSKATRDGKAVEVDRGDIRLFVRFNPSENVKNEVSFTGGYPLRAGTAVKVVLGSETFSLNPGPGDASGLGLALGRGRRPHGRLHAARLHRRRHRRLVARHDDRRQLLPLRLHRRGERGGEPLQVIRAG